MTDGIRWPRGSNSIVHGTTLELCGLDAIDGTPVLDIKPVMKDFLPRGEVHEPAWASALMQRYW